MIKLYFGGAENPHWKDLLHANSVTTMGLSYIGLSRRVKFARPWLISEHFPDDTSVFLDSGAYSVNTQEVSREEAVDIARAYQAFVSQNHEAVGMVSEFDAQVLGKSYIEQARADFYDDLGDKFLPIWHSEYGLDNLEYLASRYERVGILQADVNADISPVLNKLVNRYDVKLHGVAMTRMEAMKDVRWDSVGSTSWLSPSKFGDTILWEPATKTLHRYPKKYKDEARKRHRSLLSSVGFDSSAVEADNTDELLRVSIWSWQQFVAHISGGVTNDSTAQIGVNPENPHDPVDNQGYENRNRELAIRRETKPIPGVGFAQRKTYTTNDDGTQAETEETQVFRRSDSARVCNNCFLKDKCPEFLENANCAYGIPLHIETPSQVAALEDAIITMQAQRVIFMQMVEEMEGGYADPNLSSEIDRLGRLIKARRESEKEGFTLHVEGSQTKGSSLMTDLFGRPAADAAEPKFPAVSADEYIQNAGIIDAEVVDEDK